MNAAFLSQVKKDYPDFRFLEGKKFAFRPPKTIVIGTKEADDSLLLLHELGHALLGHREFSTDVGRLKMERAAWGKARELAGFYGVDFDDLVVERELDTYREWLDTKSRCKKCGLTRYQTPDGEYHCPKCEDFVL